MLRSRILKNIDRFGVKGSGSELVNLVKVFSGCCCRSPLEINVMSSFIM